MPSQAVVEPLTPVRDDRGFVIEPLSVAQLSSQRNCHVVWTAPGSVRGNHRHLRGTEVTLVIGPALVRYRDANGLRDVVVAKGSLFRFTFPPDVPHAYGAVGPEPMLLVGFNTLIHDREHPDAIADQVLPKEEVVSFKS